MARRKISDNRHEEIEYRILALLRHAKAYHPNEIKYRLLAICILAEMWNVGTVASVVKQFGLTNTLSVPSGEELIEPESVASSIEEKPLTSAPIGGKLFDEMGWRGKDGDQKN
jgi:hypothetical protein